MGDGIGARPGSKGSVGAAAHFCRSFVIMTVFLRERWRMFVVH